MEAPKKVPEFYGKQHGLYNISIARIVIGL